MSHPYVRPNTYDMFVLDVRPRYLALHVMFYKQDKAYYAYVVIVVRFVFLHRKFVKMWGLGPIL